jgi:hypothetical protein
VRLVGRALSDGEVRADYVAGAQSMAPGTVAMDPDSRALPGTYARSCAGCVYDGVRGVLMCAACKDRAGYIHATTLVVASSRAPVCNEDGTLRLCAGN